MTAEFDHTFYAGPIDGYFGYKEGRLQYRSLIFERLKRKGDFQGNAVINYCQEKVPYTRISEHKHFCPLGNPRRYDFCFQEYSKQTEEGDTPYYPMRLDADKRDSQKIYEHGSGRKKDDVYWSLRNVSVFRHAYGDW